jgi:hypothetical protein
MKSGCIAGERSAGKRGTSDQAAKLNLAGNIARRGIGASIFNFQENYPLDEPQRTI